MNAFLQRRHIVEFLPQDEEERVGKVDVADEVGQVGDDGHVVARGPRHRITVHILAPWAMQEICICIIYSYFNKFKRCSDRFV